MTTEQRGEIPSGYVWKDCSSIKARFPMPTTWFYMAEEIGDTRAFFMTRESIQSHGMFVTGLSVNAVTNTKRKADGKTAVQIALELINNFPSQPISQITRADDGPLVIARRFFSMPNARYMPIQPYGKPEIALKLMQPSHFYIETVGNKKTGTVYIIQFETPTSKWKEDEEIAKTMIEKSILDKST